MKENKQQGFVKLYRSLFQHWVWNNDEPFDKRSAWVDLLRSARFEHEPKKEMVSGKLLEVRRGQLIASVRFLKDRWKWGSNTKVENFLELLQKETMITIEKGQGVSVITICKFDSYNASEETERTPNRHAEDTEQTREGHGTDEIKNTITKESKEVKNPDCPPANAGGSREQKKLFELEEELLPGWHELKAILEAGARVKKLEQPLTEEQFSKLRENYTQAEVLDAFAIMENMKSLKGKVSAYLTALNILKSNSGSPELKEQEKRFEERYKKFVEEITAGEIKSPKIDKFERRSLHGIMQELKNNSVEKTWDGAFASFEKIISEWKNLDSYTQKRTKLEHIERDLLSIITQIKNNAKSKIVGGASKGGNNASGSSERKDF